MSIAPPDEIKINSRGTAPTDQKGKAPAAAKATTAAVLREARRPLPWRCESSARRLRLPRPENQTTRQLHRPPQTWRLPPQGGYGAPAPRPPPRSTPLSHGLAPLFDFQQRVVPSTAPPPWLRQSHNKHNPWPIFPRTPAGIWPGSWGGLHRSTACLRLGHGRVEVAHEPLQLRGRLVVPMAADDVVVLVANSKVKHALRDSRVPDARGPVQGRHRRPARQVRGISCGGWSEVGAV